ncbi:DHH family phosphoesterase [Butyrivibrio sp.]|jgi:phosphoesterase RecJ-like protein|uniref:DHH family phosphoesterase n=1 Tax=Butyrivibrio sp. TaxID=28121 RepID=UPI001B4C2319|nr:bifunctional oligoribonuclease/PAP phosphatase NrnA [Butyrivibrio sp.]MBE5837643.1 bifunctional oligoribonuclease/PAP phosphatase NrnA [Butyrivibrio sp.]MBP3817954.1 bifunctional oligoribonuclease/PAP phosphatase NrnA [Butyrivibrio sp.]
MKIDELMQGVKTVGISGHIRPDGDCVGSCMGMYLYLSKNYPDARVDVFLESIPPELEFIKDSDKANKDYTTDIDSYDLFIALDCGKDRLGNAEGFFDAAKNTVNIDHHISNPGTGNVNYIVPTASSACELVYTVIDTDKMDEDIAKSLYTGMVTDTGVFKYSCTSPRTMEIAAKLIGYGFDFGSLIDHVFYEKTYLQNQILGRALLESILLMDGKCIVSVVSRQTMDFYGATSNDMDGIVNQMLLTIGVGCSIFMYEEEPMTYRVSLRSDGSVDVSKVAKIFGGGGHMRAAGCTVNGTQHDVINNITKYIQQQL